MRLSAFYPGAVQRGATPEGCYSFIPAGLGLLDGLGSSPPVTITKSFRKKTRAGPSYWQRASRWDVNHLPGGGLFNFLALPRIKPPWTHGFIAIIAADFHLLALGHAIAVRIEPHVHGGLAATAADGLHFLQVVGER